MRGYQKDYVSDSSGEGLSPLLSASCGSRKGSSAETCWQLASPTLTLPVWQQAQGWVLSSLFLLGLLYQDWGRHRVIWSMLAFTLPVPPSQDLPSPAGTPCTQARDLILSHFRGCFHLPNPSLMICPKGEHRDF